MKKEIISDKQGICLMILFIIGSSWVVGIGNDAKKDAWLGILIGFSMSLPIIYVYSRLLALFPQKDLFDILQIVFGKVIGTFISIIFIWFAFHLGSLVLRNFSEFTSISVFPDTPSILPMSFLIILCIWVLKEGIEVLGRCGEIFAIFVLIVVIIMLLLSFSQIDVNNLRPILYDGFKPVISGAFQAFSFPFTETIVFAFCLSSLKSPKSSYKVYFKGLIIGGSIVFLLTIRNTMVLGFELVDTVYFPSFIAVSLIHIGEFLQRMEIAISVIFIITIFIKTSVCILAVCKGISKILNVDDYRFIVTPVALLMLGMSSFIYSNTMEMALWATKIWPYYAFPFQVILPIIIILGAELKKGKFKRIQ